MGMRYMKFPLQGTFYSKRGKQYYYRITENLYVEQWYNIAVKVNGKYRTKTVYVNCTQELINHINALYEIDVKC